MSKMFSWQSIAQVSTWRCMRLNGIDGNESAIRSFRYGQVEIVDGILTSVCARWWPMVASEWGAVYEQHFRTLPENTCRLYYAFFSRSPGFMTLNYAHGGSKTKYATIYRATQAADQIAKIWNAKAIVCQITNARASARLLHRWGYVQHAQHLGPNHYIKRLTSSSEALLAERREPSGS